MTVRGYSHVAIGVRDMDRSLEFYRDVVGLHVRFDDTEAFPGREGFDAWKRRGVYLELGAGPGGPFLVLDQQLSREPFGQPAELFQVGVHHFGFATDDVDAVAERARARGFEPTVGPSDADRVTYGLPPGGTIRTMFLRDPEGNVVQFDELPG